MGRIAGTVKINTPMFKTIMHRKGFNQTSIANFVGVERATVSLWITRQEIPKPRFDTLIDLGIFTHDEVKKFVLPENIVTRGRPKVIRPNWFVTVGPGPEIIGIFRSRIKAYAAIGKAQANRDQMVVLSANIDFSKD